MVPAKGLVGLLPLACCIQLSISNLSKSLLTSICNPEMVCFQSKACLYGCKHKDDARKAYTEVMNAQHRSFTVAKSGLVLDMSHPFIGAGLVECSCCGKGTLEIFKSLFLVETKPSKKQAKINLFIYKAMKMISF